MSTSWVIAVCNDVNHLGAVASWGNITIHVHLCIYYNFSTLSSADIWNPDGRQGSDGSTFSCRLPGDACCVFCFLKWTPPPPPPPPPTPQPTTTTTITITTTTTTPPAEHQKGWSIFTFLMTMSSVPSNFLNQSWYIILYAICPVARWFF